MVAISVMIGRGGVRMRFWGVDLVVSGLTDEVDSEGDEPDAEAREGVAPLIREHRVLPPLIAPPEKLSGCSQWLRH